MLRVTRDASSLWSLYTSELPVQDGAGAKSTDVPSLANTSVFQGSVIDTTFTEFNNGYFGFMAIHGWSNISKTSAEFDQLFFDTNNTSLLPIQLGSFSAFFKSSYVLLKWTTESEKNNLGL